MQELLASQLPVSGLGLRVTGGAIKPQHDMVIVALIVEIDAAALPFRETNGQLSDDVEIAFVAMDSSGKTHAANRSVGNLRVPVADRVAIAGGLRYVLEFAVPPGRYQVRTGVYESGGQTGGSAILDVDAPNPAKAPLWMGAILLAGGAGLPTSGTLLAISGLLRTPATAGREFTSRDTLTAFANICASGRGKQNVVISAVVRSESGAEIVQRTATTNANDMSPRNGGYNYVEDLPLRELAPGHYVLTIDARTPDGASASGTVPFLVR